MVIACDQVALSKNEGVAEPVLAGGLIFSLTDRDGRLPCRRSVLGLVGRCRFRFRCGLWRGQA